jgi:hypothetical protein
MVDTTKSHDGDSKDVVLSILFQSFIREIRHCCFFSHVIVTSHKPQEKTALCLQRVIIRGEVRRALIVSCNSWMHGKSANNGNSNKNLHFGP